MERRGVGGGGGGADEEYERREDPGVQLLGFRGKRRSELIIPVWEHRAN